jgi:hypothetical protein
VSIAPFIRVFGPCEPLAWRFTGIAGLKPYLTDKQYAAQTPETQKWYEPICSKCATPAK